MSYMTIDAMTGLRRSAIRWPNGMWRPVDGCRWCGHPDGGHALFWSPARPGHVYEPPTRAQRAARVFANTRIPRVGVVPAPRHAAAGYRLPDGVDTGVLRRVVEGLKAL